MPPNPLPAPAAERKHQRLFGLGVLFLFVLSVSLVLLSARGDLFIDEVVSLDWAENAPSWTALFTQKQTDNNHLLNTLVMRAIGDQKNLFLYRIQAVVFGAALLAALIVASRRFEKSAPAWVVVLAGLSFPMILYSSEARGYAAEMFFAVLAFELLQRCWERLTLPRLMLFWAVMMLGLLAHSSFIMLCMALGMWSLAHDRLEGKSLRAIIINTLKFFGLPALFMLVIYAVFIRKMIILGGNIQSWWEAISDTTIYLLGFSPEPWVRLISVLLATALVVLGLAKMIREKRSEWIFLAAVIFVAPALMLILWRPKFLYFRYFSISFPFFYLLLAYLFGKWFSRPGKVRWIPVVLAIAMTAGHMVKVANLIHYGRGRYRQAVEDMAAATPGPVIRVASDHDFRNGTLLSFYARYLPPSKTLEYITKEKRHQNRPDWIVLHCLDTTFPAYPDIDVGGIGKCDLFGVYPYCGSSGLAWFVYRCPPEPSGSTNQPVKTAAQTP